MCAYMKNKLLLILAAIVLCGCQSLPPLNFSVPNVGYSTKKIDAELKSMTVGIARSDEGTGALPLGMEIVVPQFWQTSVIEAMNRMAIFRDDSPRKLNLSVKILKLHVAGLSWRTETSARYELIDRKTGAIIYTQDISSEGYVPFSFSSTADVRIRESINISVRNNIAQFLQALETVDVDRPMFPTEAAK